jgi:hypothetical protein
MEKKKKKKKSGHANLADMMQRSGLIRSDTGTTNGSLGNVPAAESEL